MIEVRPVEFTVEDLVLRGSAYLPQTARLCHPTLVMHHGFGSTRVEVMGLFVQISRALADRGVLVVAFDRAGHGESDGDFFDTTVSGDIDTSRAIVRHVVGWTEVDPQSLHLLGMSLGSVIASVVASETDLSIASLCLLSPAAIFVEDIRARTLQGRSTDEVDSVGYFDLSSRRLGPAFFDDAREFDVYGRARGYRGPVRIIHGGSDEIVPNSSVLRYGDIYREMSDITIVPHANHGWSTVPTRQALLDMVVEFVVAHARIRP